MIGILTFSNTINYGADLQMYALYKTIKKIDCSSEIKIIAYKSESVENREFPSIKNNLKPKHFIVYIYKMFFTKRKKKEFLKFKKENFSYSDINYDSKNFNKLSNEFDKIIVGSDQVWNTNLTDGDTNFFLKNIDSSVEKYAYAASFGVGEKEYLNHINTVEIADLLQAFQKITCREIDGTEIIKQFGRDQAEWVLDPTFLLNSKEWEDAFSLDKKEKNRDKKEKYILIYFNKSQSSMEFAKKYAKKHQLKIKYISMKPFSKNNIEIVNDASPKDFLDLIKNAEAVITGSYHGFILSLNFNKPVLVTLDNDMLNRNSRISTIINQFDIGDSIYRNEFNQEFFNGYTHFNVKLDEYRKKSLLLLESMVRYSE